MASASPRFLQGQVLRGGKESCCRAADRQSPPGAGGWEEADAPTQPREQLRLLGGPSSRGQRGQKVMAEAAGAELPLVRKRVTQGSCTALGISPRSGMQLGAGSSGGVSAARRWRSSACRRQSLKTPHKSSWTPPALLSLFLHLSYWGQRKAAALPLRSRCPRQPAGVAQSPVERAGGREVPSLSSRKRIGLRRARCLLFPLSSRSSGVSYTAQHLGPFHALNSW